MSSPLLALQDRKTFYIRTRANNAKKIKHYISHIEEMLSNGRAKRITLAHVVFLYGQRQDDNNKHKRTTKEEEEKSRANKNNKNSILFALMAALAKLPHLRWIHISIEKCKMIMAEPITYFLNRAKSLQMISLEDMTLKGNVQGLKQALMNHSSVTVVRLIKVWCWPPYALIEALASRKQQLDMVVTLDRVVLSHQTTKAAGIKALSSLWKSSNLKAIHIVDFSERVSKQVMDMLEILKTHPSVQKLYIKFDNNAILPEQVLYKIAQVLEKNNTCLEVLELPWMGDCALSFVKALQTNNTLKEFRVIGAIYPPPSNKLLEASCQMLQSNTTLQRFLQSDEHENENDNDDHLSLAIKMYLELNKLDRKYLLEHENSNPKEWYKALRHCYRGNISITFYLLSRNPSILCTPQILQTIERQQEKEEEEQCSNKKEKNRRVRFDLELNEVKHI